MKGVSKEKGFNEQELLDLEEDGKYCNPLQSPQKNVSSSPDKDYIKIPHHCVVSIPITLMIIFIIYLITKNFYLKKKSVHFFKPKSVKEFSKIGGEIILDIVRKNLRSRISLDNGLAAKSIYKYLIDKYVDSKEEEDGKVSFRHVRIFNLEEMCGYEQFNEKSFSYWLKDNFINHVDIKPKNVYLIDGTGTDLKKNAEDYNKLLMSNQLDLQIIDIKNEGNIGFMNKGDSFEKKTHVVTFTRKKKKEMAEKYFDGNLMEVPEKGIIQGIKNIMEAKNILILARGKESAQGIKYLMKEEIDKQFPITALKEYKGNLYVVADEDACSLL